MRIVRAQYQGKFFYAAMLEDGRLRCLEEAAGIAGPLSLPEVRLLAPVAPSKVVAVGLNYSDHARELNMDAAQEPVFFLKPPSSIIAHGESIVLPKGVGRVDYEAELAVVISETCRNVSEEEAPRYIFGYTCANDVTARDLQARSPMFGRCKGYDTFCPVGPWIETEAPSPNALVRTVINGEVRQQGRLEQMITPPLKLVSFLSSVLTLFPGDLILTGTPAGIGPIRAGDSVSVEVEGVGTLTNSVVN